jgi:hypothetical protein
MSSSTLSIRRRFTIWDRLARKNTLGSTRSSIAARERRISGHSFSKIQPGVVAFGLHQEDVASPAGEKQIDYADYRVANGVKIPFRRTFTQSDQQYSIQVEEVEQNIPVDDSRFAKPM